MAPVLKTGVGRPTGGSNPSPSARKVATMHVLTWEYWGGAREADWARLLSECWGLNFSRGFESRPPRSYNFFLGRGADTPAWAEQPPPECLEDKLHGLRADAVFSYLRLELEPSPSNSA